MARRLSSRIHVKNQKYWNNKIDYRAILKK